MEVNAGEEAEAVRVAFEGAEDDARVEVEDVIKGAGAGLSAGKAAAAKKF